MIPREELIDNVWNGNAYVGEKALTNAIWHLRQKLKGVNGDDDVIETIRKIGYRLLVTPIYCEASSSVIQQSTDATSDSTSIATVSKKSFPISYHLFYLLPLLAIVVMAFWPDDHSNFDQAQIIQITKDPGSELFASPSPDGRYVVYRWLKTDGTENLYMRDTQQPELPAKQLTFDDKEQKLSVWGIEGKYLYYASKKNRKCMMTQLKVATGQTRSITPCPRSGGYYYVDVSPDNKILAFHGDEKDHKNAGIYFLNLDDLSQAPERFSCKKACGYEDRDMAFSPDGKFIAVSRRVNRFNENIYLVNLKTKAERQLTYNEEDIVGLTWHPNGKQLVYATQRADVRTGYIIDIDDNHAHKLDIEGFSYPEFAKHSGELFYQQRKEKYFIASISLDKQVISSPFPILHSDFNHHYPDYSQKSQKMVYVSNESGYYELWQADADGDNREKLTSLAQTIRYPKWSHSGTKVAFIAPEGTDQGDKIHIYDLETRELTMVESSFTKHNRPTWSFDDRKVISAAYAEGFTDLFAFDIETANETRLTFNDARFGIMTSPTTLLYTNPKDGLWQKEVDSNEKGTLKIAPDIFDTLYTWHYQGDGVYYRKNHDGHHEIAYYDFASEQSTPLVHLPLRTFKTYDSLTYVQKENKLLFTSAIYPQSDIKKLVHPLLTSH